MNSYASIILGGSDRNVEFLGAYIAWLINARMFVEAIERISGEAITRVRMQSATGADFLATELHGELEASHLTENGRDFTEHYFLSGFYKQDFLKVEFTGENEWLRYAELAPLISAAYRDYQASKKPSLGKKLAKVLKFPGKH